MSGQPEKCKHGSNVVFCRPCFQETHSSYMEIMLENVKQNMKILSQNDPHIHSPEFLRQT